LKLRSFELTDDRTVVEVALEQASLSWFEDPVQRWLDVEAAGEEELNALLAPLEIDWETLTARGVPGSGAWVEAFDRGVYIQLPTQISPSDANLTNLSLLCLPTTLVTLHQEHLPAMSDLAVRLRGRVRLKSANISGLVSQIVLRLAAENFFALTTCRHEHEKLSKRLIEESASVAPEEIFSLRRKVSNIADANEDHAFCVDVLQKIETVSFSATDQLEYLKEIDRSLERHQHSMDRLEENVKELHQQFLLAIQDKTGSRLKVLTILSAVFLPLTLIAGVYGMNFQNMPELGVPYGYFAALGFMGLVAIGMLGFFYAKGWFD
jgi:magnesium transporter